MTEEKKVPKKTTPKKVAPKKKEEVVEEEVKSPKVKATPTKRQLDNDTNIEVMNNTTGRYGYIGRSGFAMEMSDYGDVLEIPFGELKRMRSEQKRHLEDAFIVILDEDAVKELRYEKLYENIFNDTGLEELLSNPDKLKKVITKMPVTMKQTVATVAKRKFKDGDLYDMRVKKVIEDSLNIKIEA